VYLTYWHRPSANPGPLLDGGLAYHGQIHFFRGDGQHVFSSEGGKLNDLSQKTGNQGSGPRKYGWAERVGGIETRYSGGFFGLSGVRPPGTIETRYWKYLQHVKARKSGIGDQAEPVPQVAAF